jgi:hypothetical protein
MDEKGWLTFYNAALETEKRFGVSQAESRKRLRLACADQEINSMKAPLDEANRLPIEFWTRIASREWREREVDYDGPDADGCAIEVMIWEADFRPWLNGQQASQSVTHRPSRKQDLAKLAIKELWPDGIGEVVTSKQIEKQVGDWLANYCKQENLLPMEISRDTILRAAARK